MFTQLTVKITNESPIPGSAVIYQRYPGGSSGATLAWLVAQAQPGNPTTLAWSNEPAFVWGEPGNLPAGAIFQASQLLPADPSGQNEVTLTCEGGACRFTDPRKGDPAGQLSIVQDPSVFPGRIATGIGMSNLATNVLPAQPGTKTTFADDLQYWIAFGNNFRQGEVLNLPTIQNAAQVVFPPGVTILSAVFGQDGSWTITPEG